MSTEEIWRAQSPLAGWESETRAFRSDGGDPMPRWADFHDLLDAMEARREKAPAGEEHRSDGWIPSREERRALKILGLSTDADARSIRSRYAELLRRYHPDHNHGDRTHEARLAHVVKAWQLLSQSRALFSRSR